MLDFKAHSLKEHLDHIFNGPIDSPLMLGHDSPRTNRGNTGFTQDIKTHEGTFIKARSVVHPTLREFNILGNRMHYHLSTFKEIISFKNVYSKIKINKKGETRVHSKSYHFGERNIEVNYEDRTYKSICFGSHTYTRRILKNGITNYSITFPYTGCELYETYNSKGVCTESLFHFPYESGNGSIQLHLINGSVEFFCKGDSKTDYMLKNIKLPELKDASIVNLYNEYNCFFIDLMIPDSGLYEAYQYGLEQLRTLVQERSETAPYDKDVFRNMLAQISENTIKYET
ncbi:hypothetical protein XbC2_48 [Xanthomonas phage XbC2]|nr:hypothetical protein XbC2_48 [Xanthomonas phage XbC2]